MIPLTKSWFTLAIALVVPFLLTTWVMLVPKAMSLFTYSWCVTILMALAAVVLNSFRNGQATGSMGQLLYETEVGRRPERR
jgi:hypothetical protein